MGRSNEETRIVVAGAGYAGLHVAQRLGGWLERNPHIHLTLLDQHDYHLLVTELPRVATGSRELEATQIGLSGRLSDAVTFRQIPIEAFVPGEHVVRTATGDERYDYLVIALGSAPNDFAIPGLAQRVLYPYSASGAEAVWEAVNESVRRAAHSDDTDEQRRLMTVVVGGGGATGVEIAGGFAEELPEIARAAGAPPELGHVVLVEAGPTILAGSSDGLIHRAKEILDRLHVEVRTSVPVVEATEHGLRLKDGSIVEGGVYVWAGGVKAPSLLPESGLPTGYNGRLKVDQYLRVLDHPEIFAAGDAASVVDPESGHVLGPLAQTAIEEGTVVARNLRAEIEGELLTPFHFHNKGFVVSVGGRRGVADIAGLTIGGRLAHALKDAIELEYRQSVKHLRGWGA
jgi:NADH:ubiquinone reductase (H+-translocating)